MLQHMRQAALPRRVVHIARINKGGVAEDRRIRPLADNERQPLGQDFGRDSLLKTLQVLRPARPLRHQHQRPNALPKPGNLLLWHPVSFVQERVVRLSRSLPKYCS